MFCTNCGKYLEDDAIYCNYCGSKISVVVEEEIKEEEIKEVEIKEIREEKIDEIDISKLSITACILLSMTMALTSVINIIRFYIEDINYLGQIIFGLVFIVSAIFMWKSKKIGAYILIPFASFKIMSSIYYYLQNNDYFMKNLIVDEIFYLIIILLLIIGWKNLK